ncbi:MFS transporter [Curtobacterium sp. MCBD17_034]|uniref:MFS transporter n=1 Tax=unclassified Curtobacterium TaxID=257496 RepID=UPI000DA99CB9|nr:MULTISPECIES: MFS transporter [unclassified Curtobacterium]PZF60269.1 MFS transporter [Curtobacterium sp. MCBD17_034]PZM34954.1 MFS transporter [Curtobacterium sp. MCBD17_031]WIE54303.1 MFS transporter [Curtobacterium sp. MCBD17_003]
MLVGPLLNPINTTMVSVALAPISRDLGIGSAQAIWLVAALYLASAVAQPSMGKLADRFGPKKVFLTGLVIVGVAGFVPEFLTGFGGAVTARVLIGIGTSSAYPAALTTLRQQSERIGKPTPPLVLGALSITSLVSAAAGPPLGGALIAAFGWHAIFLVNVPLAAFGFVVAGLWLPSDASRPRHDDGVPVLTALDPAGMLLMTGTVSALLVFLLDLSDGLWWLLGVAVALLVALVLRELRAVKPFIDVRLLATNRALSRTYVRLFLVYMVAYTMTYGFSQWVQDVAGYSSDQAGYIQLPSAVIAGVVSFLVARRTRVRTPLVIAATVPVVGGLLLLGLHAGSPVWLIALVPTMFGVPQGLASVSNQAALYRQVPSSYIGTAAGLSRTSVYIGAIAASSLIGGVFGERPTTPDLHLLGWVIVGVALLLSALTILDRALRRADRSAAG